MSIGQIAAEIRRQFGEAPSRDTLRRALAHSTIFASTAGLRPRYYLKRLPRKPQDWFESAGLDEDIVRRRASRFLLRNGRWIDARRVVTGIDVTVEWLSAGLLGLFNPPRSVSLESFGPP